jgi:NADPH:quinone reductase-like Zn-dependent oxidoreductase
MRAFTLDSFDTPPGLREDLPSPQVGPGELLVRVQASSVNPVDAGIAAGHLKDMFPHDVASRSPDQLDAYAAVVREGGRIASSAGAAGEGAGRTNVMAVPAAATLDRLAGLLAAGTLSVPIQASYPLDQADQALKALTGQHTQGKLAITLP